MKPQDTNQYHNQLILFRGESFKSSNKLYASFLIFSPPFCALWEIALNHPKGYQKTNHDKYNINLLTSIVPMTDVRKCEELGQENNNKKIIIYLYNITLV